MSNITFKGLVRDLKKIYQHHEQINDFGFGYSEDITIKHDKEGAVQYPYMFIVPSPTTVDERQISYQFELIIMDRVINYTDENLVDILSDTNQIIQDVIAQFKYGYGAADGDYATTYDLQTPVDLRPFSDKYDDYVTGWLCTLNVTLPQTLDRCIAPFTSFD